ncbi:MAG TPA: hypothetical protein VFX16_19800 [Pseudonocardiaceae bacterium]|nr:hypothetical protein [Pseudonocardiaceae bacterium]
MHGRLVFEDPEDGLPRRARIPRTPDGLRAAVLRWTCRVVTLAGSSSAPWTEIAVLLESLLTVLSPMRGTMRALADVDPSGDLARVVMCLSEATWHLNDGDIRAARDALAAGADALAGHLRAGD